MGADELTQLLGHAFEEAPVALSVIDLTGRQLAGNRRYRELLGLGSDHVAQLTVTDITDPTDATWTTGYLDRVARGELEEFRTEKTYRRPDGSTIRCELVTTALRDGEGVCCGLVGVLRPVGQPQVVSDQRLRRFIEHVDDAITLVDASGNVLETTGRYTEILGYPAEFWERRSIFDLLAPDELDRALGLHDQLLQGSIPEVSGEFRVVAADGHHEFIRLRAVNLLDDPHVGGIVVSSRNVSHERHLRDELQRAHDEAHELATARSMLIATVSHELRNPLHAVSGMAELLANSELPEPARPIALSLARQLTSLSTVTADLLDATRTELGVIELRPVAVDLVEVFDDTAAIARASIGNRPVEFRIEMDPTLPEWVQLDRDRLGQVLRNLVGNAIKFTDEGSINLAARRTETDQLQIEVTDSGVGIPVDELDHVLEPFATASTGSSRHGAGLGLSVVRQLVGAMQGAIRLDSEVGRGTTFTILLPMVEAAAPPPDPAATPSPDATTAPVSLRVLVVEDDPVNQQLATAQLERLGHVPVVVESGEAALELLRSAAPVDVVLMDEQLPGLSGTETARAIREHNLVAAEVRMISVTASASEARRAEFVAAGMDDLLAKPLSLATLDSALQGTVLQASDRSGAAVIDDGNSAEAPVVDVQVLDDLIAELDDVDSVCGLVRTFVEALPERVASIAEPGLAEEHRARAAHTLGSGAAMVGASGLSATCRHLERGAPVPAGFAHLCEQVSDRLTSWLDEHG